jgi:hypothetical protein
MKKIITLLLFLASLSALADTPISLADYYQTGDSRMVDNQRTLLTTDKMAGVFARLPVPVDLKNKTVQLRVKSGNWTDLKEFSVLFATDQFVNNISIDLKYYIANPTDNEWIDVVVPVVDWKKENNPDVANINYVMWRATGTPGTLTQVSGFNVIPESSKAMLSITIDDGDDATMPGFQIMSKYKLKGGIYLDEKVLGIKPWINQSQVDTIARAGWDISGHVVLEQIPSISKNSEYESYPGEYRTNINTISSAKLDKIIRDTAGYLKKHHYQGSDIFAYPNGIRSNSMTAAVAKHFKYGLNIDGFDNPTNYISPYSVNRRSTNRSTTVAQIKEWIDTAKQNHLWLILNFHTFKDNGTSDINYLPTDFEEICRYVVRSDMDVLPVSQAIGKIKQAKSVDRYYFFGG